MSKYELSLEVSGPTALWTRPDSGDTPSSYPAPTRSAVKGIFESVLWLQSAEVFPTRVEICSPIVYHTYTTNYGGPLRKSEQVRGGTSFQLVATVLINVCYRIYAEVRASGAPSERMSTRARAWERVNGAHAYLQMFARRLQRGQFHRTPCLGWQEFVPDYLGSFRSETQIQDELNFVLPSMLESVFPRQNDPLRKPTFRQNVKIERGVLVYAP
jgi:CRISPR-associated protein Cas5d